MKACAAQNVIYSTHVKKTSRAWTELLAQRRARRFQITNVSASKDMPERIAQNR